MYYKSYIKFALLKVFAPIGVLVFFLQACTVEDTTSMPETLILASPIQMSSVHCSALPMFSGNVVHVSSVSEIKRAVDEAITGDTILIADGIYNLNGVYLRVDKPAITLRSASGERNAVILDGNYATKEIIQVVASDVTIADITLRKAYHHPIHVSSSHNDISNTLIYNVHVIDPGQQAIKINPAGSGRLINGIIACSHIELSETGRSHIRDNCYTGGIDAHHAQDWVIRDNWIEGFWCSSGLSEHAIHMWKSSSGTLVERNRLVNNARGVGFGLGSFSHTGGILRNNMIHVMQDVGIGLESSKNAKIYNNSVYTENYKNSIEYRFPATSGLEIINNVTNHAIVSRNGGNAMVENNITDAEQSWFRNAKSGDLHLVSEDISRIIDKGQTLLDVNDDFDGDSRPLGNAYDVGADEYATP